MKNVTVDKDRNNFELVKITLTVQGSAVCPVNFSVASLSLPSVECIHCNLIKFLSAIDVNRKQVKYDIVDSGSGKSHIK